MNKTLPAVIILGAIAALTVWAATPYDKDETTGVIKINCGKTVSLLSPTRPANDTPEVSAWVAARNHSGRVCIPGDKVAYQVAVITKGDINVVGSGVTNAPIRDSLTPILVRIRQEEPIAEPAAPIGEIEK